MRELNSNTLTCRSNEQSLDENFIEFLLTYSHYVSIQALSFMKRNDMQTSHILSNNSHPYI